MNIYQRKTTLKLKLKFHMEIAVLYIFNILKRLFNFHHMHYTVIFSIYFIIKKSFNIKYFHIEHSLKHQKMTLHAISFKNTHLCRNIEYPKHFQNMNISLEC